MWINEVTEILVEAAEVAILPRFRALAEGPCTGITPQAFCC